MPPITVIPGSKPQRQPKETPFLRSLAIQCRVINALFLREVITRYGRSGVGVLWLILEPMIFTLGILMLWMFVRGNTANDIPIAAFAITGYSSVLMWRNAANRASGAIGPNTALMHHRNVKLLDIFYSRILLEWIGGTASFIILTIFFSSLGLMSFPEEIWYIVWGWLLLVWFSLGLALIVGALSERFDLFDRVWHVATYLMFPLSGAMFMVEWLPQKAQALILLLPMVHGTEMIRHGFFGSLVKTHEDPVYFAMVNLIMMFVGLVLVKSTKNISPEG